MSRKSLKRIKLSPLDRRILNRIQEDIPFKEKPWESIAEELKIGEDHLLERITFLKKEGIVRRISAIFSPHKINHVSTLVGVKAVPEGIERVVEKINSYPEVTHNYRRESVYNIWFTLVAGKRDRIAQIIRLLEKDKDIEKISEFGIVKLFKINVRFSV